MGRYLTVSGEMMMNDIAKSLKVAHPERKWATWEAPYWLAIIASFFHPKIDVSWARRHLRKKLYWDASPAEEGFADGMAETPRFHSRYNTADP